MKQEIVYFEFNNWTPGKDYPDEEPFKSWIFYPRVKFHDEEWLRKNKLCVLEHIVDMSVNFCVTTTKDWVEKNCPKLLTDYKQFLRYPDECGDVYGRFNAAFLEYEEENIGLYYAEEYDI